MKRTDGRRQSVRTRYKSNDNIKMDFEEIEYEAVRKLGKLGPG